MSDDNPFADVSDDALVATHSQRPADNHYLSEMLLRHKNESAKLGIKVWWLNTWLLLATVAILGLTVVLVWTAFRDTRDARRESSSITVEGVWVVWMTGHIRSPWWAFWRPTERWSWEGAVPTQSDCIAAIVEAERMRIDSWREPVSEGVQSRTWIFSQLRRGKILVWRTDDEGRVTDSLEESSFYCLPESLDPTK